MASSSTGSSSITRIGNDPRMSRVVIHNGIVYLSGQTDQTASDIQGQTKNVLAKIDKILQEDVGITKSSLLTASIWVKDIEADFKGMNEVWCAWVDPQHKPVRATVQSTMAKPNILVEIQVTAAAAEAST